MKVVELLIDENEELAGGSAIALVNHPAHEEDFFQFNKEGKELILNEEQQEKVLQQFSQVGEDHNEFMMKGHFIKSIDVVGEHLNVGRISEKFATTDINARPIDDVLEDKSVMDYEDGFGKYKVRFRYAVRPGRPSLLSTSRKFCKEMINANKTYRLEDINRILNGFQEYGKSGDNWGNTFFKFGGPNCGHVWIKVTYQEMFSKKKGTEYKNIGEQDRSDAALVAGTNMNEKTLDNPSPQTIKRAGLGQFAEEQKKKQLLAGPILIPDKMIYRFDKNTQEEYYVYFSKSTTEKIAYKYLRDKNQSNLNVEHNPNNSLDDVSLVESWIITDPKNDKSNQYGYELPEGTWFGIVQVKDSNTFQKYVESGKTRGFSLEGYFESKLVKFYNSKIDVDTYILSEIEKLILD